MVLLSVIITSYNEINYIEKAIKSCIKQNFDNYEIIIGDDGSSDGSIQLIEDYSKIYPIKYFVMDRSDAENELPTIRVSNLIRKALSIARGKYINILNGDDYFCDLNKFSKQVRFLEDDEEEIYSAVTCNFKRVDCNGNESLCLSYRMPFLVFWSGEYIHISCFLFRKKVFDDGLLLDNICDDCGMQFSIGMCGKINHMPDIMFAYNQRSGSIMTSANNLELHLLEIILLEECLNTSKFTSSCIVRCRKSIRFIYENIDKLEDVKYKKYVRWLEKGRFFLKLIKMKKYSWYIFSIYLEVMYIIFRLGRHIFKFYNKYIFKMCV